jgi:hypothetical protein
MEDPMTDPRDEALRACVGALELCRAYVELAARDDGGLDECDIDIRADHDRIEAALATARAALMTVTPAVGSSLESFLVEECIRDEVYEAAIRADERAACIALVYGHAGSDNDAQRIVDAIKARDAPTP